MASSGTGIVCVMLVLSLAVPSLATVYTVGDASGWVLGVDYTTWTSGKTFAVGDTLVFNYGSGHTADEVSSSDYNTCTTGNAITSDNTGATKITLKTAGGHYFICGVIGHCSSGMKLAVTVGSGSGTPSGTPSSGSSTTPASPAAGTNGTVTTPTSSTPDASSGAAVSASLAVFMTWVAIFILVSS